MTTVTVKVDMSMDFDLEVPTDGLDLGAMDGCTQVLSGVRIFQARMDRAINEAIKKIGQMSDVGGGVEYECNSWGGPNWKSCLDR